MNYFSTLNDHDTINILKEKNAYLGKNFQFTRKYSNMLKLVFLFCFQLIPVSHEFIKKMINNVSLETLIP